MAEKSTYRLQSVRLSRQSAMTRLDSKPVSMSFIDSLLVAHYDAEPSIIDIFDKSGVLIHRLNIARILHEHGLTLSSIDHVLAPRLHWSQRQSYDELMYLSLRNQAMHSNVGGVA